MTDLHRLGRQLLIVAAATFFSQHSQSAETLIVFDDPQLTKQAKICLWSDTTGKIVTEKFDELNDKQLASLLIEIMPDMQNRRYLVLFVHPATKLEKLQSLTTRLRRIVPAKHDYTIILCLSRM